MVGVPPNGTGSETTEQPVGTDAEIVADKAREHALGQLGKFRPIVDSARLILHGGVLALSLYVLAYLGLAWLDMAGSFYRAQMGDGYLVRGWRGWRDPNPGPSGTTRWTP